MLDLKLLDLSLMNPAVLGINFTVSIVDSKIYSFFVLLLFVLVVVFVCICRVMLLY